MELFLSHGDEAVTKEELCLGLWGTTQFIDENALQVNLTRLKKTLAGLDMDCRLIPIRGAGYRLVPAKQEDITQ